MTPLQPGFITWRNKAARVSWAIVYWLLFRFTPVPLHAWRAMLLRIFGAKLGAGVRVYPSARIWAPWNLHMGDASCIGWDVDCYCVAPIHIGAHATVSQRAYLCSASHDYDAPGLPLVSAPITIGARAWITAEAFVGPGVHVGEGAVALARAVVTRDVEAWTVVGGHPARALRQRVRPSPGQ
jgi:putative colanic acid biosynthesis acetyltransferase WcaF